MSRNKKKRSTQPVRRPAAGKPASAAHVADPLSTLLTAAVAALLVARMLVPTESAAEGETLWLVQLWLATAMVWAWKCIRNADHRIRFDWCDGALWLLIAGQVVSALVIVATEGHKRNAINMLWEWIGLGVMFFVIRQVVVTQAIRRRLLGIMVSVAVVLALFGLWQHYVWYSQTIDNYGSLRQQVDELRSRQLSDSASTADIRRLRELQLQFVQQGIPMEGQARDLWEKRLRSSREPFGMFALANTFAGVLLVWLIVLASTLLRNDGPRGRWLVGILAVAIMSYCLLLTKSRTAWVGLLLGLVVLVYGQRHRLGVKIARVTSLRRSRKLMAAIAALALIGGMVATAVFTGGLDRDVLAESPKSLEYRVQYWAGTWNLIRELPLFGTGPGNFRQRYLKHKLPESSEDIADPHNFLLDVWANAGSVGLIGLLTLLFVGTRTFRRASRQELDSADIDRPPRATHATRPMIVGAYLGFLLVTAVAYLSGDPIDNRLLALLAGFAIVHRLGSLIWNHASIPNAALAAAAVGLLVHLCGAGGIAMPAIGQTFLVLLALATVPRASDDNVVAKPDSVRTPLSARVIAAIEIGAGTAFMACLLTATAPILNRQTLMSSGNHFLYEVGQIKKAMSLYRDAAAADPQSPDPWDQLAQLSFELWKGQYDPYADQFDRAVEHARQAIARDPANWRRYHQIGQWYLAKFERTNSGTDAADAVNYLSDAVSRHPTNPQVQADLAHAFAATGNLADARLHAQLAQRLDQINRKAGHSDKFLPESTLDQLREY